MRKDLNLAILRRAVAASRAYLSWSGALKQVVFMSRCDPALELVMSWRRVGLQRRDLNIGILIQEQRIIHTPNTAFFLNMVQTEMLNMYARHPYEDKYAHATLQAPSRGCTGGA